MVFTDYEGPWVLNDFAYELCMAIFNNDRFFRNISEYDDYLYYVVRREGYEAGYTLKLIVPFIYASGQWIVAEKLAERVIFVPEARLAARKILEKCRVVIISTAYRDFVEKTAKLIGFREVHASDLDFKIELDMALKKELLKNVEVIASLRGEELFRTLDEIFSKLWNLVERVRVIGAREKAEILESYAPSFPIAVGDSITDCKMFEKARELGGVAIAFNGNRYALEKADIAIVSQTALAQAVVIDQILNGKKPKISPKIGKVFEIKNSNFEKIVNESMKIRIKLRGIVGILG